ncbi:MAG TPA: RNA polymerase sigma factor [Tahibacter sp.]|nr:RNA polymerase sigma factor [Tahibacter sp.]
MNRDSERIYDEFLVAAAVTGDRRAFARLVARWQPRLWGYARRILGDAERAKDVAQDAWIEILKGLARLDDVAAFPAWAYRIVTRRCQRVFAANGRAWADAEADIDVVASESSSSEVFAETAIVLDAVRQLPPAQRAAIALFYLEDLSVAEIAVATDVPPGTVKTRLLHARRKVRALLDGENS